MEKIITTRTIITALKKMRLNKIYRMVDHFLPTWLNERIKGVTDKHGFSPLVHVEELKPKYIQAWTFLSETLAKDNLGDYLEFGVSHGTSLSIMYKVLKQLNLKHVRIFGFDSFEGMPAIAAHEDENRWHPGEFASPIEATTEYLSNNGIDWSRTFLIKGWFSETLTQALLDKHNIRKASVIMIDCDIYSSSKQALDFCRPLIKDKTVIFFDDWIDDKNFGEPRAWEEFLNENPTLKAKEFGTYQPSGRIFEITVG
jgi:O-methyltransferase